MKLLFDAHAALWWVSTDERVGAAAAAQLEGDGNRVLLSAVVVWEVAIKRALGRLTAARSEGAVVVTRDPAFRAYGVPVVS